MVGTLERKENDAGLMNVPETAIFLRLKEATIRAWILRRKIPYVKLGGKVFVRKMDALALVERSIVPAEPQQAAVETSEPKEGGGKANLAEGKTYGRE